jgi:hypothetical protein
MGTGSKMLTMAGSTSIYLSTSCGSARCVSPHHDLALGFLENSVQHLRHCDTHTARSNIYLQIESTITIGTNGVLTFGSGQLPYGSSEPCPCSYGDAGCNNGAQVEGVIAAL